MNIALIEKAARSGVPFQLKVADGDAYEVPHEDYIAFPPRDAKRRTHVMVYGKDGVASYLPLLTITSLTYREPDGAAR